MTPWAKEKEKLRQTFRKRIRKKILKRDHHECRVCGYREDLTVHHIYAISTCLKQKYRALLKEEENLVTLCENCHLKAPNGDGYYNWEIKQRIKFYKNCSRRGVHKG